MKNLCLTVTLCVISHFCYFHSAQAQEKKWDWLNPTVTGNRILSADLLPHSKSITLAGNKFVMSSEDYGKTWRSFETNFQMTKVVEPYAAMAFGFSTDYVSGKWTVRIVKDVLSNNQKTVYERTEEAFQLYDMMIDDSGSGLAIGGYEVLVPNGPNSSLIYNWGLVLRTTDFGDTWNAVYEQNGDILTDLMYHDGKYLAYGTDRSNFVIESPDGISWSKKEGFGVGVYPSIQHFEFASSQIGFLSYHDDENLYYSTDGGKTWLLRKDFDSDVNGFTVSGSSIIVFTYGKVYVSEDLGVTWREVKNVLKHGVNASSIASMNDCVLMLDHTGAVLVSNTKSFTFENVNENINRKYLADTHSFVHSSGRTFFPSEQIGYSIAVEWNSARLLKTRDGGCNWEIVYSFFDYATAMHFINDEKGFVCKNDDIYYTLDGGAHWTLCNTPGSNYKITSIAFFNDQIGVAKTKDYGILRTTDGGMNWVEITFPSSYLDHKITIINSTTAIIGVKSGMAAKTTDAGQTWTIKSTGFNFDWAASGFFNDQLGFLAGSYSDGASTKHVLIKTINGGTSWTKVMDLPHSPTNMRIVNSIGFLAGANGMLYKSEDSGTSWQKEITPLVETIENIFPFANTTYITGEEHALLKKSVVPESSFTMNQAEVCQGATLTATNTSSQALSYIWKIGGKVVSTEKDLNITVGDATAGATKVQLVSGTCHVSLYDVSEKPLTIHIRPHPTLLLNGRTPEAMMTLCDSTYTMTTQSFPNYLWSNGSSTRQVTVDDESSLSVKVTSALGCVGVSDTIEFQRSHRPVSDFSFKFNFSTLQVDFTNKSQDADTYLWNFGNGVTSTAASPNYLYPDMPKRYDVSLIAAGYCGSDTTVKKLDYMVITGIEDNHEEVSFYPNPVIRSGMITISDPRVNSYTIDGINGSRYMDKTPVQNASAPIPALTTGAYILTLYRRDGSLARYRLYVQ